MPSHLRGHAAALVTILIWGSTFVVTKVLLIHLGPTQVLVLRFAAASLLMVPFAQGFFQWAGWKTEARWAAAGLTGVTAYYLCENAALALTTATDVGLLVTTIPLMTLAAARFGPNRTETGPRLVVGSALALGGVVLVLGWSVNLRLSWAGDLLALGAAGAFTAYSLVIGGLPSGTHPLVTVARSFLWGTLAALPFLGLEGPWPGAETFLRPEVGGGLAFLILAASGAAYASWNSALRVLGPVKTTNYIYTVPVVNTALGALVLGEPVTALTLAGCGLIVGGVAWGASRA